AGVGVFGIAPANAFAGLTCFEAQFQGTAEVASVKQDDLHAAPRRAGDLRRVNAFAGAARVVGWGLEEVSKDFLRLPLRAVLGTGVVLTVVVIVPRRQH